MNKESQENGTQAIERALTILKCFPRETEDLSLSEIAKLVQLPYSTVSRIVGVLEKESFLIRNKKSKRYSLGRMAYSLGYCAQQNDFLRKVIYPYLVNLRDEFGETALIYVREGNFRVCFEKVPAFHSFKFSPSIGSQYVLWAGAGGRGFLAFLAYQELDDVIKEAKKLTTYTTIDKQEIMQEIYSLCKNGYSYCANEYQEGFSSIAGPIVDSGNNILCTIAVTGPSTRFTENIVTGLKKRIPAYCMEISTTFGWNETVNRDFFIFSSSLLNHIDGDVIVDRGAI